MSFLLRTWMFAIAVLLVAEDFQYVLTIGSPALEQAENFLEDGADDNESKSEKEEESKEETKGEDKNKSNDFENIMLAHLKLAKNKFSSASYFLSDIAHELETPPPEV